MQRTFSPAAERNRAPLLAVLRRRLNGPQRVLEIGSGTGQHAIFFAQALPLVYWQCSELAAHCETLDTALADAAMPNLPLALAADASAGLPRGPFDAVFTANTLHIMPWSAVVTLIESLSGAVRAGGLFCAYGPFNYRGAFTSPSNAQFDAQLRATDPERGVRDFEDVDALLVRAGFSCIEDNEMPANNRCIFWMRDFG